MSCANLRQIQTEAYPSHRDDAHPLQRGLAERDIEGLRQRLRIFGGPGVRRQTFHVAHESAVVRLQVLHGHPKHVHVRLRGFIFEGVSQ